MNIALHYTKFYTSSFTDGSKCYTLIRVILYFLNKYQLKEINDTKAKTQYITKRVLLPNNMCFT